MGRYSGCLSPALRAITVGPVVLVMFLVPVPVLIAKHVLTAWDVDMFAAYCETLAAYTNAAS